jgi:lipopolysaccharide-induced tumor necrosis factor-alpha factor
MSYIPLAGDSFQQHPDQGATAPLPSGNSFGDSQHPHQANPYPQADLHGGSQHPHQAQPYPQGDLHGGSQPPHQAQPYPPVAPYGGYQPPNQAQPYSSVPGHPVGFNPNPENPQHSGSAVNYSAYPGYSQYPGAQPVYNYPGYSHDGKPIHQHVEWVREPQEVYCHYCNTTMMTETSTSVGLTNWAACLGLVLFGCGLGCCFIPFCIPSLSDYAHKCSHCGKVLKVIKIIS